MKRSFTVRPVLASQERGTVNTYRNKRNPNKYIEVKKGNDGHSYARQYMKFDTPDGEVKNYIGARSSKGRYFRNKLDTIDQMLEDYYEVPTDTEDITSADNIQDITEITQIMYGDFCCSCGCGSVLGRATNGTDSQPIEYSYGVGEESDIEGYDWRMFTERCWNRIKKTMSDEEIYNSFEPSPAVE